MRIECYQLYAFVGIMIIFLLILLRITVNDFSRRKQTSRHIMVQLLRTVRKHLKSKDVCLSFVGAENLSSETEDIRDAQSLLLSNPGSLARARSLAVTPSPPARGVPCQPGNHRSGSTEEKIQVPVPQGELPSNTQATF